jgi:molybdopterin-containing oxidoreductase family iron-sulfur binding subunit
MAKAAKPFADHAEDAQQRRWGMVVDLDRCTGCQACVVACHAENNIQIAGEDEALIGRTMHWIRIERYWEGEYPNVKGNIPT